ncbi:hypothetical protein P3X46_013447 [Hevea brasiliensis]|uniref:Uncharacterized protein n=1 Tax=Hevea brasiliensis TaxID=3981 RepID=A0ABQ9M7G7_HEVBR|nr:uncharacterized protein LOC110667525 [Hevea brasiliensis]KAJ9174846.1 hypothetical protein P3X46_013447 [Hevea brasiliensis]
MKAWKKLKKFFKKTHQEPYFLQPPPCHCCCSYSSPVQPSAPPLSPWLVQDQTNEVGCQCHTRFSSQEVGKANHFYPSSATETTPLTYQQYTVPNPVYGMPVVQTPRRERLAGFYGFAISFGVNVIRCFCPCFGIREVD